MSDGNPAAPGGGSHDSGDQSRRSSKYLPLANISRIMKKALPPNVKIAKDAKEAMQECVSEFISFFTSEASENCQKEKRKALNGDDLLCAMVTLGFEDYIEPLKVYLARYREMEGDAKGSTKGGEGSTRKDGVQPVPSAQPQKSKKSRSIAASSSLRAPGDLMKVNGTRNWSDLPPDVTAAILQKLGAIEILETAQKVCVEWRKICKDPSLWRSIDMCKSVDQKNMPYDLTKMVMHAVDRSCGQLVDISVENFGTGELLRYIAERSGQLRRLRLVSCSDISDKALSESAEKLPLLDELIIFGNNISEVGLANVGRSCPQLKSLAFNQQGSLSRVNDDVALAVAKTMPGLLHLQLFGNSMTNVGLQAVLDGCPKLESLDLRHCFQVDLTGLMGKLCSERIKNMRCPDDSTHDYGFSTFVHHDSGYDDDPYYSDFTDDSDDAGFYAAWAVGYL